MLPHNFSCQRAVDELGYTVRPFEKAAADAWTWFCEHGYAQPHPDRHAAPAPANPLPQIQPGSLSPSDLHQSATAGVTAENTV